MNEHKVESVIACSDFKQLNRQRNLIRFGLSFLVLASHLFFVGGIAFYSQWFGQKVSDESSIPIGIVGTVAVIVFMLVSEGIYIWVSDKKLDRLQHKVNSNLQQADMLSKGKQPDEH